MKTFFKKIDTSRAVVLLAFAGIVSYCQTLFYPFVHDDIVFIEQNPSIGRWDDLGKLFLHPAAWFKDAGIGNEYYRPILEVFYKVEYLFFGLTPGGYHLVNILLHILNAILVFLIAKALLRKEMVALFVAALFTVHPVQTEAVAAVSGVSNVLSAFFMLTGFYLYLRWDGSEDRGVGGVNYYLSLCFLALALLTKEQSIVLPAIIVFYIICFKHRSKRKLFDFGLAVGGFIFVLACYLALRAFVIGNALPGGNLVGAEANLRLLTIPRIIINFLGLVVYPRGLHYYRTIDFLQPPTAPIMCLVALVLIFFVCLKKMSTDKRPVVIFGAGLFFLAILPTLNIIPMVEEFSYLWTAEHFLYLPLFGVLLATVGIVSDLAVTEKLREWMLPFCLVLIMGCSVLTVKQNTYWASEPALFERALKYEPQLGRLHYIAGRMYYFRNDIPRAESEYLEALKIMQGYLPRVDLNVAGEFYFSQIKAIRFELAHCFEARGDVPRALAQYGEAIKLYPNDKALLNNLGVSYLSLGDLDQAIIYFTKAIEVDPKYVSAINNLAYCLIQKNNYREADAWLKKGLLIDPEASDIRQNLEQLHRSGALVD